MILTPGERLGPYEVLSPIGRGGMGEVFLAKDTRLDRVIAVKVLSPHLGDRDDFQRRFELEARAISSLHHPHICTLFDVGDTGRLRYLVMECLEGETLEDRLKRGPVAWPEAMVIGRQILDALRHAHQKGILHRDLKPSNIFLLRNQQQPWAKLLDFGLAKIMDGPDPGPDLDQTEKLLTDPSHLIGTPLYMAPEVLQGQPASPRSDIHAAGAVLYEMLCGRRAFQAAGRGNAIAAVLRDAPESPSAIGVKGIPAAVENVVMRCLAKPPEQRWQTVDELYTVWEGASSPEGSVARPQPVRSEPRAHPGPGRAAGSANRTKALVVAACLGVLLCAAFAYWLIAAGSGTRSIAILPFVNTSGNPDMEYLGDGITESLINSLSRAPNLTVLPRNSVFRFKGRDVDAKTAGQTLQVQTVLLGRVMRRDDALSIGVELIDVRDNRLLWGERYNRRVADMQSVQEEISTEISERLRIRLTGEDRKRLTRRYTQSAEAYQLYLRGRFHWNKKTPDGFNKGIEYLQQAIQVDPNYAPAYAGLAALYNNLANYNFALIPPREAWAKAKAAATKAIQIDDALASAHTSLALVAYQWEWDWALADREFRRSIELDPSSPSVYEPNPSSTLHWYSHFLMSMGRVEESYRMGRRALELDPLDLANNSHQGWHYLWIHQHPRAVEPLKKAIDMDPAFPVAQWYLGLAYEQTGAWDAAIEQFQNCVRITRERPSMVALLGHAYAATGRTADATAILKQLRAASEHRYVPPYPIAAIHAALGHKDEAFQWLERAYEGRDSWMNYLGLDSRMDPLRSDPRFGVLLRRMNL